MAADTSTSNPTQSSKEVLEGTQRLANELEEFTGCRFSQAEKDDAIELQLATCRKLREVSCLNL